MQKIILTLLVIMLLLNNVGCQTIKSYEHYNGMTKEEIRKIWGEPSKVSNDPSRLKYNADEVWLYHPKSSQDFVNTYYFYFKNGIVVNHEAKWWEAL